MIDTDHLRLWPLGDADAEALHHLFTDPDVRRHLWDDQVIPREQTMEVIETSQRRFAERGFGLWGVHSRDAEALIGFCGYWFFRDPPELELLYGIAPAQWGRGYATEAARALVRYGFEQLQLDTVRGSADAPNVASVRVLEKAGLQFEKRLTVGGRDTVFYHLRRDAFQKDDSLYALNG